MSAARPPVAAVRPALTGLEGGSGRAVRGMTLVEVLVAMAVASLLLAAVGSVLGSSRAAGAAEERAVEPWRALDLAAELLAEEVGMAGHEPYGLAPAPSSGAEVLVRPVDGGHGLAVRFVDDRLSGPPVARALTFTAGQDARGLPQLYRSSGSGPRQPLVEGLGSLVVESVVDGEGASRPPDPGLSLPSARALVLRLTGPAGEERAVVVSLPAGPTLEVAP